MNTPELQVQIDSLEHCYCKLTGRTFRASGVITGREHAWTEFVNAGYGIKELEETILWIKRGILADVRRPAALGFRRLIADLGCFEDELNTARAEKRNAKPAVTPKERVIAQARPGVQSTSAGNREARPIGHWIAKLREAAK